MDEMLDAMLGWRQLIDVKLLPANRHHVVWRTCLNLALVLRPVAMCIAALVLGGTLAEETMTRKILGIRVLAILVTINYCLVFWSTANRANCVDLLLQLERLARLLEPFSGKSLHELQRARRYSNRAMWLGKAYSIAVMLASTGVLCFRSDRLNVPLWPWPTSRAGVVAGNLLYIVPLLPFGFASFGSLAYFLSCLAFEIGLYAVLGEAVRQANTPAKIKEVAALDVRLTALGMRLRDAMTGAITAMLTAMLVPPLLSTVLLFLGHFTPYTLVAMPYVLLFVSLCAQGQDIQDSFGDTAVAAYSGEWVEVTDSSSRAVVLLLVCRRNRRLGISSAKGVMSLNLATCRETLNTWYSLLQVLVRII